MSDQYHLDVVSAKYLTNMIAQGEPVNLTGSLISGQIEIRNRSFDKRLSFVGCTFDSAMVFRECTFAESVSFGECTLFDDLVFYNCTFAKGVVIRGCQVNGVTRFNLSESVRLIVFDQVTFRNSCVLNSLSAQSGLMIVSCRFRGVCDWIGLRANHFVGCSNSRFYKSLKCENSTIAGRWSISKSVLAADASWQGSTFEIATFDDCRFSGEWAFRLCQVARLISASNSRFRGEVRLGLTSVGVAADFRSSVFSRDADFSNADFKRVADFSDTEFSSRSTFDSCRFGGSSMFLRTRFLGQANFGYSIFDGGLDFSGARFHDEARLELVTIRQAFVLHDAQFHKLLDLMLTKIEYFVIPKPSSVVLDKVVMRGLKFDRLETEAWRDFLGRRKDKEYETYNVLEAMYRHQGFVECGKEVHYEMRSVQLAEMPWSDGFRKLGFALWKYVGGFGVRLGRLILWNLVVIALGIMVFCLAGALEPAGQTQQGVDSASTIAQFEDVALFTLRTYIPAPIAGGSEWIPSNAELLDIDFSTWASILSLLGWILVPVTITGLVQFLRRESMVK